MKRRAGARRRGATLPDLVEQISEIVLGIAGIGLSGARGDLEPESEARRSELGECLSRRLAPQALASSSAA